MLLVLLQQFGCILQFCISDEAIQRIGDIEEVRKPAPEMTLVVTWLLQI